MNQENIATFCGFAALLAALSLVGSHPLLAYSLTLCGGLALHFAGFCGGLALAEEDTAKAKERAP